MKHSELVCLVIITFYPDKASAWSTPSSCAWSEFLAEVDAQLIFYIMLFLGEVDSDITNEATAPGGGISMTGRFDGSFTVQEDTEFIHVVSSVVSGSSATSRRASRGSM